MTLRVLLISLLTAVLASATLAPAQIVNPADKQRREPPTAQGEPVIVEGQEAPPLSEEARVGPYNQPVWTVHRRFPTTRIYVRPEGQVEFEYWLVPEFDDGDTRIEHQFEVEFGLPYRFQLDLYLVNNQDGNDGPLELREQKLEVRWALADWDEIWGNPTLYLEWASKDDEPDGVEGKLLLGGEIAPTWHWGTNLVFEAETGGMRERAYEITGGVSKTLQDRRFQVGGEIKAAIADDKSDRGDFETSVQIGPSVQFWPLPNAHLDVAPLFGVTDDSPDAQVYVVFGWAF